MTIKDIAKECGCGLGTVSRALNNKPGVKAETREKILAVVDKYGFVTNNHAKQLKAQDSKIIAIIIKGASNILLTSMLSIIQKRLEKLPFSASVTVIEEEDNEALVANQIYYEQKPLGIIFLGGNPEKYSDDFGKIQVPCVLISNEAEQIENSNLSSVSTDNLQASEYSARYLIEKGHRNIGIIGGNFQTSEITKKRFQGFLNALNEADIKFDPEKSYVSAKYSFSGGSEAVKNLMEKNPDITAIWTMSDAMAIGAMRQLKDMGYNIPEQISVIGFDGLPIAGYYSPRLTTIKQQDVELAQIGLDLLLKSIESKEPASHILVPFRFMEGESVRCIN